MSRSVLAALLAIGIGAFVTAPVRAAPAPETASTAAPLAGALKEIGRVRAQTTFCRAVLERAGIATNVALQNDATLDDTARYLETVDLDDNKLAKPQAILGLQRRYAAISTSVSGAIEASERLRDLASTAPTATQRDALVAYANAIGGTLHREREVASSFRRFAMYLETHEPIAWQAQNEALFYAARTPAGPFDHGGNPHDRVPPTLTEVARQEASHMREQREPEIADEIRASVAVPAAFDPCRAPDEIATPVPQAQTPPPAI